MKTQTKHTPGPWFFEGYGEDSSPSYRIASYFSATGSGESPMSQILAQVDSGVANSRLIAAAPDLLEACKAILHAKSEGRVHPDEPDSYETAIKKIELAIATAEGSQS